MGILEELQNYWEIPDLSGRIAIVTGGNTGLGKLIIKSLLEHNAKVYMAARSKPKAEAAIADLHQTTGKEAIYLHLDLSDLNSVRDAAKEFLSGLMWSPLDWLSPDGYDIQWATNVMGHWYLTELLMPALIEGAKTSPDRHARVVTTSSAAANFSTIDYDTFRDGPQRQKLGNVGLYYQSKFANAVVARETARRYADKGIISVSLNPGNLYTDLQRHCTWLQYALLKFILYPQELGALTPLWAGTMPEILGMNGEFLIPWARLGRARKEVYDPAEGEKLWNWLEAQLEAKYGDHWRNV
ncbi:hypothetical protein NM688_g9131 [Phlebia brevispora]|uniref:Uncharacterized protein n=1 Tax=Phlebia brevispora TaxID=194682 RepID=A0ACC1RMM7_9APHY|nr:hypothetical protein NM688_g9131 [Phlebia brevispora]